MNVKFGIWVLGLLLLAACSAPPTTVASGPNPTAFIATRVAELLTQNAPPPLGEASSTLGEASSTGAAPTQAQAATPGPLGQHGDASATARSTDVLETPLPTLMIATPLVTPCADQACVTAAEHFWLERPIPAGYVNYPARTYAYGSTQQGAREPHHGVEFENPAGTPIVAAVSGVVIVAGDDTATAYGPTTNFYGNLVVVQLNQTYHGQPVYNLYAHMQSISVTAGQHVNVGDLLGTVGQTGVAIGPHLHFEVRVGRNDYRSSRNPELWLKPLRYNDTTWGAIAGRVVDRDGNLVTDHPVVIRPIAVDYDDGGGTEMPLRSKYFTTYARDVQPVNGDDAWQENFAIGDLPAGTYTISVSTTSLYRQTIIVIPGHISWVTFVVNPPAPAATPPP